MVLWLCPDPGSLNWRTIGVIDGTAIYIMRERRTAMTSLEYATQHGMFTSRSRHIQAQDETRNRLRQLWQLHSPNQPRVLYVCMAKVDCQ
jgi:hypothetical protein